MKGPVTLDVKPPPTSDPPPSTPRSPKPSNGNPKSALLLPTPHSPFPIPHFLLPTSYFLIFFRALHSAQRKPRNQPCADVGECVQGDGRPQRAGNQHYQRK